MSNKLPTLSIVTPSYNQGRYIEETIKSVLSQEGQFCIEYFIMDGGSTDCSVEIIKKYETLITDKKWPIKCRGIKYGWVSEKDKGQTDALNKGFLRAAGDMVSWINSDDIYFPGAFSVVTGHFLKHPEVDFVYGDGDVIDETGRIQWGWISRPFDLGLLKSYNFRKDSFNNYIMQQATFWRRTVHDKIGLLDISFDYAMDYEYWIRAGSCGLTMAYVPVKLGKFRMVENTKSLSSPMVFWPDALEIFRRYNGAKSMQPFLEKYFLNRGRYVDFDISGIVNHEDKIRERWRTLPVNEQNVLNRKAKRACAIACLGLANEALAQGKSGKSDLLYQESIKNNAGLAFHPKSWMYHFRKFLRGQIWQKRTHSIKGK